MSKDPLEVAWRGAWPGALAAWSPYTQLRDPVFYLNDKEAAPEGMAEQIAAIRLLDQTVMVNFQTVRKMKLEDLAYPILAHEIGHHVFVPGNLGDNGRMLAVIRRAIAPLRADLAPMVANLWGDLLINDRLHKAGIDIAAIYHKMREASGTDATSNVWKVYTRAYEIMWRLPVGCFCGAAPVGPAIEADAQLVARLVRSFPGQWLMGARRFANILFPWLQADEQAGKGQTFVRRGLQDTKDAGRAMDGKEAIPDGLSALDEAEMGDDPGWDEWMKSEMGEDLAEGKGRRTGAKDVQAENTAPTREGKGAPGKQFREPFEYGELLKALGLNLSAHDITTRYYRERALPYLIPFPQRTHPRAAEPMVEGYDTWEASDPVEALDFAGTIARSPIVIPGITTVQRTYVDIAGTDPARAPLDLDIYVDSSGSMPNPAVTVSYLALAAAILALSALRAGARVQATLWSGPRQVKKTEGFVRDEKAILGVVTGCFNGSTAFPIHVLRDTWEPRKKDDPPGHVVVISDDGVDTMMMKDEKNRPGLEVAKMALEKARGGGTLVLNMAASGVSRLKPLQEAGFRIHAVQDWAQLVEFAKNFVRENYGGSTRLISGVAPTGRNP